MPVVPSSRMLGPVRRWALRELKVHPGQVAAAAGCPAPWTIAVLRDLVGDTGAVVLLEADTARVIQAQVLVDAHGWTNVTVLAAGGIVLPERVDRLLLDHDDSASAGEASIDRLISLLGPGARLAAVCRRGAQDCSHVARRLPSLRRESFYGGAAYALWGQIP